MPDTQQTTEPMPTQGIADMQWVDPPSLPPTDLPYDDGEKMETPWHAQSLSILTASIVASRGGRMDDYYVGANMFVYYSLEQVHNVDYKGPDVYFVEGVDGQKERLYWAIWEESGRYPDVIIELTSPSTEREDIGRKKDLYERTFRTSEYFCIARNMERLSGWRLAGSRYTPIAPDEQGRLWSERLGCSIGAWQGFYMGLNLTWPRLFHADGALVLLPDEAAQKRADELAARVAALEAELQKLKGKE